MVISVVSIIPNLGPWKCLNDEKQPGISLTCCIAGCRSGDVGVHIPGKKVDRSNGTKEEDNLCHGSAYQQNNEAGIEEEVSDGEGVCSLYYSIDLEER